MLSYPIGAVILIGLPLSSSQLLDAYRDEARVPEPPVLAHQQAALTPPAFDWDEGEPSVFAPFTTAHYVSNDARPAGSFAVARRLGRLVMASVTEQPHPLHRHADSAVDPAAAHKAPTVHDPTSTVQSSLTGQSAEWNDGVEARLAPPSSPLRLRGLHGPPVDWSLPGPQWTAQPAPLPPSAPPSSHRTLLDYELPAEADEWGSREPPALTGREGSERLAALAAQAEASRVPAPPSPPPDTVQAADEIEWLMATPST